MILQPGTINENSNLFCLIISLFKTIVQPLFVIFSIISNNSWWSYLGVSSGSLSRNVGVPHLYGYGLCLCENDLNQSGCDLCLCGCGLYLYGCGLCHGGCGQCPGGCGLHPHVHGLAFGLLELSAHCCHQHLWEIYRNQQAGLLKESFPHRHFNKDGPSEYLIQCLHLWRKYHCSNISAEYRIECYVNLIVYNPCGFFLLNCHMFETKWILFDTCLLRIFVRLPVCHVGCPEPIPWRLEVDDWGTITAMPAWRNKALVFGSSKYSWCPGNDGSYGH